MPQKGFCLELKRIPLVTGNCLFRICVFILVFSCAHILKASAIVLTVLSGAPLRASGVQVGHLQTHTGLPACQEIPEMFASDTSAVSAQETCLHSVGFTVHKQTIHTVDAHVRETAHTVQLICAHAAAICLRLLYIQKPQAHDQSPHKRDTSGENLTYFMHVGCGSEAVSWNTRNLDRSEFCT